MEQSEAKRKLAQDLKRQLVNCIGYEGDELANTRKEAYDYYFQRARGDEIQGRSSVVTGDLSSMVEGNLAQMAEPLSNRRIAEFCAYDELDEEQAQIESDCVNELIFKRNNGFIEVVAAIKDAMLLRNCVVKVWIDDRTHKRTIRKENVAPEIIEELLRKIEQQQSGRGVATSVEVHTYDPQAKKISFTVTKNSKKFRVECLAPENFLVPKNWHRHDLDGIPFCAERHVEMRATLIERGFDKALVDALPKFNNKFSESSQARLPGSLTPNSNPLEHASEEVEWYECYALMDDGNGASELRTVATGHNLVLADEPANFVCYATGAIIINPHSFIAISLHDKLKSTQDVGTALERALLDNLNTTTKNRLAYLAGVAEETDITDGRTNGAIRVNMGVGVMDVRQAVMGLQVPDTSGNILMNIEHNKKTRSEMGGATLDMATGQMQLNDRVGSQGLDRAYSVMEQLASFMTKTVAQTLIRSMFLIAHETLRTGWDGPICFKRGNKWIVQEPGKWQSRDSVQVNLGASLGERTRISNTLEKVMAKQEALAGLGMEGILVDVGNYHKAILSWLRINDIPNPEQFFMDPRSDAGQKGLAARAQQRAANQQKQDALMQQAIALEQLRTGLDKYKTDAELQFKYWERVMDAQTDEAKLALQGVTDVLSARAMAAKAERETKGATNTGTKTGSGNGAARQSAASGNS